MPGSTTHRQKYHLIGQSVAYAASGTATITINGGSILRNLYLRFQGGIAINATGNTKANWNRGCEWETLQEVRLVGNSNDILRRWTGAGLLMWNFLTNKGRRPRLSPLVGSGIAILSTDPVVDSVLRIPLMDGWLDKPMDTALDTTQYTSLRLELQFAPVGRNIAGDGTNNVTAVAGTYSLWSMESIATDGPYRVGGGNFVPTEVKPFFQSFAGAGTDQRIIFPTGPACRGLLINASTTANSQQTDAPLALTNFKLDRQGETIMDMPAIVAWQMGWLEAGSSGGDLWNGALTPPAAVTNGGYGPTTTVTAAANQGQYEYPFNSNLCDLKAWWWLDLAPDGRISEAPGTNGFSNFDLLVTTASACDVTVYKYGLFQAPAAAAASSGT